MSDRRIHLEVLGLDTIDIADPCTESWDAMSGDEVSRFCGLCRENVYNLSGMTRSDALRLVTEAEGKICVRFYRRKDGTVVTRDCAPDRLAAIRRAAKRSLSLAGAAVAGLLTIVGSLGLVSAFASADVVRAKIAEVVFDDPVELMGEAPIEWQPGEDLQATSAIDPALEDGPVEEPGVQP